MFGRVKLSSCPGCGTTPPSNKYYMLRQCKNCGRKSCNACSYEGFLSSYKCPSCGSKSLKEIGIVSNR